MKPHRFIVEIDSTEYELPTRMQVCPRCQGHGSHTNPSIDGNGITADEMAELGDDFRDDYMSGAYDVTCETCGGANVIPVVDTDRCEPALLEAYRAAEREEYDYQATCAAERRMGA